MLSSPLPASMPVTAAPAPLAAAPNPAAQGISDASAASRQQMANAVLATAQAAGYNPHAGAPASMPVALGLPFTTYLHAQMMGQQPHGTRLALGEGEETSDSPNASLQSSPTKRPPSFSRAKGAFAYAIAGVRTDALERAAEKTEAKVHPALAGRAGWVDAPTVDAEQHSKE